MIAWVIGSANFRLKKLKTDGNNVNTLKERDVEKDLGEILEVTLNNYLEEHSRFYNTRQPIFRVEDLEVLRTPSFSYRRYVGFQVNFSALNKCETYRNPESTNW